MALNQITKPKYFEAFIRLYLNKELKKPLQDFHKELIGLVSKNRIAIAAPRGFAKSTYYSFFYPLFMALEEPGSQIMLVSATGSLAEEWLCRIRNELDLNIDLRADYGDQEGKKWTSDEIQMANGSRIMAKGAGKQIRGFRPTVVICDDLETDEMVLSVDQRKKFDDWFWSGLMGTLTPDGQVIVIGTILHPESFLSELLRDGRHGWSTRFYQAIKPNGESLWPGQWPIEKLEEKRKEHGEYAFAQEYMNEPIPDELRKFKENWFHYFETEPQGCVYFTTVDPAIEVKSTNDCTAIVTCAVDSDNNIYVVDVINRRMLPKETIDRIFQVYQRYNPAVIGVEEQGFQKMLRYALETEKKERGIYPITRALKSGGRRKSLRIEALQPRFENGTIFIKKQHKELQTQLLRFPSPRCHDDIIDALAYQLDIIRPAQHEVKRINPNCFMAVLQRRRIANREGKSQFWGNHQIAGINNG